MEYVELSFQVPIPDEVLELAKELGVSESEAKEAYLLQVEGMITSELDFQQEQLIEYTSDYLQDPPF
jgi:hypothetical protein